MNHPIYWSSTQTFFFKHKVRKLGTYMMCCYRCPFNFTNMGLRVSALWTAICSINFKIFECFPFATMNMNIHILWEAAIEAIGVAWTIFLFSFLPLICNLGDLVFVTSLRDLWHVSINSKNKKGKLNVTNKWVVLSYSCNRKGLSNLVLHGEPTFIKIIWTPSLLQFEVED